MQKLVFSGGSVSGSAKSMSMSSRPSLDFCFAKFKLIGEKLVKEQASVKTDLEMAKSKLKKYMDHVCTLNEAKLKLKQKENEKLKKGVKSKLYSIKNFCDQLMKILKHLAYHVQYGETDLKQKEDDKFWEGLKYIFSSTKSFCDQVTETLQHLACQVCQDDEKDKVFFEVKHCANTLAIDALNNQLNYLSLKFMCTEDGVKNCENDLKQKEDEIFWEGLELIFYSTKSFCDQIIESLQHLADDEKVFFENRQMNDLSLKFVSAEDGAKNCATKCRLRTSTTILALIFHNIGSSEKNILIGTDSRQVESLQKEQKKPKDKKKKKNKEKVVDEVNKIEKIFGVHVAAAGNVKLTEEIKRLLKEDVTKLRNEERTVELFSNLAAKHLQKFYEGELKELRKLGDVREVGAEFIFGGFILSAKKKEKIPSLYRVSSTLDRTPQGIIIPKDVKCASVGSGGDGASSNLLRFIKSQDQSHYIVKGKENKQPESDDDRKRIDIYLQQMTMTDYFKTIYKGLKQSIMEVHDKNSGGTIHIRQITKDGFEEHFDPPPKGKVKTHK